jgi:hypothetical protein
VNRVSRLPTVVFLGFDTMFAGMAFARFRSEEV